MKEMPFFMNDEHWFTFDFKKNIFVLTPHAPEEARKSYEEYMKENAHGAD